MTIQPQQQQPKPKQQRKMQKREEKEKDIIKRRHSKLYSKRLRAAASITSIFSILRI